MLKLLNKEDGVGMAAVYSSKTITHLGLISGVCKEFNIVRQVDKQIPVRMASAFLKTPK